MKNNLLAAGRKIFPALTLITLFCVYGCTVKYVADYDETVEKEIVRISKEVNMFYSLLLESEEGERNYALHRHRYLEIEADLRTLVIQNSIRPLNEESTKQAEIALDLWLDDKNSHKDKGTLSDFIIKRHREQFHRVFIAMAKGEAAKE